MDLGDPIWKASYATAAMKQDDCIEMLAKLNSLDGGLNLFNAPDTRRVYPRAYPTGSFTDSGLVFSLLGDGYSLAFNGLPASFQLSVGDYFHYAQGGRRWLHQIMEANTASGGGVSGTVSVRPVLSNGLTTTTPVTFKTPSCRMAIEPGSVQYTDMGRALGKVMFKAVERW